MTAIISSTTEAPALPAHTAMAAADAAGIETRVLEQAVTITLAGGPDEVAPGWPRWASCATADPSDLFPSKGAGIKPLLTRCRDQDRAIATAHQVPTSRVAARRRQLRARLAAHLEAA